MILKKKQIAVVVGQAVSLMVLVGSTAALAQTANPIQRVEVTGSNITRAEQETASPIQYVTRDDIEKSGKTTVAELLQTLAIDNQGSVPTTFGNGFASGASGMSLRGLGAASTLVLINGRRVAPYGLADDGQKVFTDINMIPSEMVERIEIVKDGASAIYGSDAIAGVVNVIMRKDYQGKAIKVKGGTSNDGDGNEYTVAAIAGFGDYAKDKYNAIFNFEYIKKEEIWNRDRAGRGSYIGRSDLRPLGWTANEGFGGTGIILWGNATGTPNPGDGAGAGSAINGNVRKPGTAADYYNRGNPTAAGAGFTNIQPGAACANLTSHPQGDPGGGCLIDAAQQYTQIQPAAESYNVFGRFTKEINANMQAYAEAQFYENKSTSSGTPSGVSANVGYPGGAVSNAAIALGAAHPDNPYLGTAARVRYLADDVGARVGNVDNKFYRFVAGLKGVMYDWDYDTAVLYSKDKVSNSRTGFLQRNVTFALLNPAGNNPNTTLPGDAAYATNAARAAAQSAAYAALPAGTYWRIGENAGLNSAAMYAALSPTISNNAQSEVAQIDFKISREMGQLPGGPIGIAFGTEYRYESLSLDPTSGTETGNIIGLGYSAYDGSRNVLAAFTEVILPIAKTVEVSTAIRYDHYTNVEHSITPRIAGKWYAMPNLLVRSSYGQGFRAPSPAENGAGGLSAFSNGVDTTRCALGVAGTCTAGTVNIITSPNPDLQPETSDTFSIGMVWDPLPKTSIGFDWWQIKRKDEINQTPTQAAIDAGNVSRDPTTATAIPGDPGAIVSVFAQYENSASSTVNGIDITFSRDWGLAPGNGKLVSSATWTHLYKWERQESAAQGGAKYDYAGHHGNCDVTNCIGTPADRVNASLEWSYNQWIVATNLNYRGEIKNTDYKGAYAITGCNEVLPTGVDAPKGCKVASFKTVDLNVRYNMNKNIQIFGNIRNLFNEKAPMDLYTYGAVSYNPLDASGAIGTFFSGGMKYSF